MRQRRHLSGRHIDVQRRARPEPWLVEFGVSLREQVHALVDSGTRLVQRVADCHDGPAACGRLRSVHRHGIEARLAGAPTLGVSLTCVSLNLPEAA
jgi:hypothetical protein